MIVSVDGRTKENIIPGNSVFKERKIPVRKELSGVLPEHDHFGSLLDHKENTIDAELDCGKNVRIQSYSGPHFSRIFRHSDWIRKDTPYLSVFSPNAAKCGENADQNNSKYGRSLRSVRTQKCWAYMSSSGWNLERYGCSRDRRPVAVEFALKEATKNVKKVTQEWKLIHIWSSLYLLQIVKYGSFLCFTSFQTIYIKVVSEKFLSPPFAVFSAVFFKKQVRGWKMMKICIT